MERGSMIVWGIAVLAGLVVWGLVSSPLSRRMRHVGSIATYLLAAILSILAPDWVVALSGKELSGANLAELMARSMETGIAVTWSTLCVVGSVYWALFRDRLSRRAHIAGVSATFLVGVIVSYYASDWLFLFD